ncbi:O-antigen polymerase [Desulfofundulus kuznetsovii DSM 6115]|uniref:O-antigen polymerase n=1 Tax=Desulfofundulus kuznetsovii (strain DSM 6115 / VKM B-1805 / 17) TaxID=760568 RepID=A0AAU8PIV5_DESK7|nr:O-antigen polymerase [Desulfofundulus kuznetsovii DSM 6115]
MHEIGKLPADPALKPQPILNLNLRPFFLAGLWFILFTSPFMRGLFFAPELLTYHIITAAAFAFCVYDQVLRREVHYPRTPLDLSILALVAAYALSLITAVHIRPAIGELLKAATYFMVYWMALRAVRGEKDLDRLLNVVYAAGIGVAAVGLLAAARVFNFPGAYENGIIMSTLQYKNALAVYLASVNVIGLGLSLKPERLLPKICYVTGNLLLVVVILGTQSRGGWVLYPLAMAAFIALVPKSFRWRGAYHLVIFLGCGLVTARVFYGYLQEAQGFAVLKYLLAGLVAAAVLQVCYHFLALWLNRDTVPENTRRLVAAGGLAYFGAVLAVYLWYAAAAFPVAAAQVLPGKVIARAETISGHDPSFRSRLEYSRDALRIVRDYPITGAGGGGWNALYHRYASSLYWTTETHNHFFQTWVEAGTLGFLALSAVWAGFVLLLVRFKRREEGEGVRISAWSAAVAALTLGVHSAFDFDLSLAALGIYLYALLGGVRGLVPEPVHKTGPAPAGERRAKGRDLPPEAPAGRRPGPAAWRPLVALALAGTLASAAVVYPARAFYAAGVAGAEGARALLARDLEGAKGFYEQAHRLDPFTASYAADLAQVWAVQAVSKDDAVARYRAMQYAREAAEAEPYNTKVRAALVNVYSLLREYDLMVAEAEALCEANPLAVAHHEILARARLDAARNCLKKGEAQKARKYLQAVLTMPGKLPAAISRPTPRLYLTAGQAAYLLGDMSRAAGMLELARGDRDIAFEVELWLAASLARKGEVSRADAMVKKLEEKKPGATGIYKEILSQGK